MDSVLIDTHVFIWLAEADPTLILSTFHLETLYHRFLNGTFILVATQPLLISTR